MPWGFTQQLLERGLVGGDRCFGEYTAAPTDANVSKGSEDALDASGGGHLEESWIVDNGQLRSHSKGLEFRSAPDTAAVVHGMELARFGTVVKGKALNENWLRVGKLFLPIELYGCRVLIRAGWLDCIEDVKLEHHMLGTLRVPDVIRPPSRPPKEGDGSRYSVVAERVINRIEPSLAAEALGFAKKGAVVRLFEWDEAMKWRRCWQDTTGWGWMMLDHPDFGPLLRPEGMKFSVRPLDPVCVAATEGLADELRNMIRRGADVNIPFPDGNSALSLAANAGQVVCAAILAEAGADVEECLTNMGVDARDNQIFALLAAMIGWPHNSVVLQSALRALPPEVADSISSKVGRRKAAAQDLRSQLESQAAGDQNPNALPRMQDLENVVGEVYEVIFPSVRIRREPSLKADPLGESIRLKGEKVTILENCMLDGLWGRIEVRNHEGRHNGWMLLHHPEVGELLRPVQQESTPVPSEAVFG